MSAIVKAPAMQIRKIKPDIGAEVTGIDLRQPVDEVTRQTLYDALVDNVALVIRDQVLSAEQYQAAASLFGELMEDQNRRYLVPDLPLISVLSNRHKDSEGNPAKIGANSTWHTDHTNQELPPKFTCLYAVELPDSGGRYICMQHARCVRKVALGAKDANRRYANGKLINQQCALWPSPIRISYATSSKPPPH